MGGRPIDRTRRGLLAALPVLALLGPREARAQNLFAVQDPSSGAEIVLPPGVRHIAAPMLFAGQRLNLRGAGANVSLLVYEPERPGTVVITLDTPGAGGQFESSLSGLGFVSNNRIDKTAIRLVNVANVGIERIGISSRAWLGEGSIGIHTLGRQLVRIRDCTIACARPIVMGPNPRHPSLAADFFTVAGCELISTNPRAACIEIEDGAVFTNLAIRDTALVGGLDGFRYDDRTSTAASSQLEFQNVRTEQGTSPDGWSFDIRTSNQSVQDILFQNVRCDSRRNGIRVRGGHRITLLNTTIDQSGGRVALDIAFNPATVLTILGSLNQRGGTMRLTNARKAFGVENGMGGAFGPVEIWVYDADATSSR